MSTLVAYPEAAEAERFTWLTSHPYIASRERALLAGTFVGSRLLEIGAAEGANLEHLGVLDAGRLVVPLDRALPKLVFGRTRHPSFRSACGDAVALPFRSGGFDSVLLRDLLHHVDDRRAAVVEAARVLEVGGRLRILEANGATVLAQVFARRFAHERGLLRSRRAELEAIVRSVPTLRVVRVELLDPAPWYRLVFHYRYGFPALARSRVLVAALEQVQRWSAALGASGSYISIVAERI